MAKNKTPGTCRECGCTDNDCRECIEKTGRPCYWVEPDLCSACVPSGKIVISNNGEFPTRKKGLSSLLGCKTKVSKLKAGDKIRIDMHMASRIYTVKEVTPYDIDPPGVQIRCNGNESLYCSHNAFVFVIN